MPLSLLLNIIAVSIALLSLWIAVWTLRIAIKTLRSQRQTEKNTAPIMSTEIQKFLLRLQIAKIADAYMKIMAIKEIIVATKLKNYPSDDIMCSIKMPIDIIHLELFYNEPQTYKDMQGLYEKLVSYNNLVDVVIDHFKNKSISTTILENELKRMVEKLSILYKDWHMFMEMTYKYDYKDNDAFEKRVLDDAESIDKYLGKVYCTDENPFTYFIKGEQEKKLFTLYINSKISDFISFYEDIFIPR